MISVELCLYWRKLAKNFILNNFFRTFVLNIISEHDITCLRGNCLILLLLFIKNISTYLRLMFVTNFVAAVHAK